MNSPKSRLRIKTKFYVPILFIIASLVITYTIPRESDFNYEFNIDEPWRHELLTAPINFSVEKPTKQYQEEVDSALANFTPYYKITNSTDVIEVKEEFNSDLNINPTLKSLSHAYRAYLSSKINDLYNEGIIPLEVYKELKENNIQAIKLSKDKEVRTIEIEALKRPVDAYSAIINEAPASLQKDTLRNINLNKYIIGNIVYDAEKSNTAKEEIIDAVSRTIGSEIKAGQRIIAEGEIVDAEMYQVLSSLKNKIGEKSVEGAKSTLMALGEFLLVGVFMGSFYLYLLLFRRKVVRNKKHVSFMVMVISFFVILTALIVRFSIANVYIIPYAIVTILIRTFIDSRTALNASLVTILLSSLMINAQMEFIILQLAITMVCIFNLKELTERSQLIRSSFFILATYVIVYIALSLAQDGDISAVNWSILPSFIVNFIFITFSYLLVYIVEKTFGFISGVSMVELANINKPLLRQLSEEAPGTFQHSMQVSNLAAAAAIEIGANPSLVRTGALYHDIGKLDNPAFFTENQAAGMNPHAGLPFEESARIIIDHVKNGVKRGKKAGLPQQIIDFITTHHGTSTPKYFYNSWKNANPNKEIDEAAFSYPGPNPFTKETAILMMADTVEAASRSLPEYTEESLRNLVNKLIDAQMEDKLFHKAPITFQEIDKIKELFVKKLQTIYHSRITYPDLNKKEEEKKDTETEKK